MSASSLLQGEQIIVLHYGSFILFKDGRVAVQLYDSYSFDFLSISIKKRQRRMITGTCMYQSFQLVWSINQASTFNRKLSCDFANNSRSPTVMDFPFINTYFSVYDKSKCTSRPGGFVIIDFHHALKLCIYMYSQ